MDAGDFVLYIFIGFVALLVVMIALIFLFGWILPGIWASLTRLCKKCWHRERRSRRGRAR